MSQYTCLYSNLSRGIRVSVIPKIKNTFFYAGDHGVPDDEVILQPGYDI